MPTLDEHLFEQNSEQLTEQPERFRVETTEQAIWAMRKLRGIVVEIESVKAIAQSEIDKIQAWVEAETKQLQADENFFTALLEGYHRRLFEQDGKKKTIKLPHGDLQLRAQQPAYTKDDAKIIEWAEQNRPELVVIPPKELNWGELRKQGKVIERQFFDAVTGEAIPGIEVMERDPKFSVKLKA